jgi:hypothetical protein
VHPHARNRETGQPDQSPEAFPQDHQAVYAVNNLITGGSPTVRVDERVRPAANFVKAPL